ncbi:hypothetical protein [Myceligenerans xiligouense]|uniref:T3SS peptide-binding chaperone domain-containing protein n=1 Tax=Myceligenerans xiligouense TaxID=253184 RepID=A0A3N4YQ66_9MICO|nr:hypothetical protein [Myceligenerans xiligouense]RPF21474.1 hypothetical protein EDD34_2103 [Myceligenerans xiligouense]
MTEIQQWWAEAASWMVASELVRRHPEMRIIQVHPSGGQSDRLWIGQWRTKSPESDFEPFWSLNRSPGGAIHARDPARGLVTFSATPWLDMLQADGPNLFVDALERAAGNVCGPHRQDPSPRTLTYALISHLMASALFDERSVRCRSMFVDTSGYGGGLDVPDGFMGRLPDLGEVEDRVPHVVYGYWVLERGGETVAVVRDTGYVWLRSGQIDIAAEYSRRYRIEDVAAALISEQPPDDGLEVTDERRQAFAERLTWSPGDLEITPPPNRTEVDGRRTGTELETSTELGQSPPAEERFIATTIDRTHATARSLVTDLAALAEQLRAEPLAAIMYGSLELFHSNLLAWFFEQFPQAADHVFTVDLPAGRQTVREVKREHKDLDLIMTFPGRERLVVENKVFSIPSAEQLRRYRRDVLDRWGALGLGSSTARLLSAYKPGWIDTLEGWSYLGYDELAVRIEQVMSGVPATYEVETMRRYARIARILPQFARTVAMENLDELVEPAAELDEVLGDAKLAMRLRKFRFQSIAEAVGAEVADLSGTVTTGFSNGAPLVEWFHRQPVIPGEPSWDVGWQLQNSQFRRAIRSPKNPGEDSRTSLAFAAQHEEWFDFSPIDGVLGTVGKPLRPKAPAGGGSRGFNRYGSNFIYRSKKAVGLTCRQLVDVTRVIAQQLLPSTD